MDDTRQRVGCAAAPPNLGSAACAWRTYHRVDDDHAASNLLIKATNGGNLDDRFG